MSKVAFAAKAFVITGGVLTAGVGSLKWADNKAEAQFEKEQNSREMTLLYSPTQGTPITVCDAHSGNVYQITEQRGDYTARPDQKILAIVKSDDLVYMLYRDENKPNPTKINSQIESRPEARYNIQACLNKVLAQ